MCTHEQFINAVAVLAAERLDDDDRAALDGIKMVYGAGAPGLRGVTYYNTWANGHGPDEPRPFVEVCAFGEQDWIQLAGTTIHELGHVVAGLGSGHGKEWKAACERLGLRRIKAAGTQYQLANFEPALRHAIAALPKQRALPDRQRVAGRDHLPDNHPTGDFPMKTFALAAVMAATLTAPALAAEWTPYKDPLCAETWQELLASKELRGKVRTSAVDHAVEVRWNDGVEHLGLVRVDPRTGQPCLAAWQPLGGDAIEQKLEGGQ